MSVQRERNYRNVSFPKTRRSVKSMSIFSPSLRLRSPGFAGIFAVIVVSYPHYLVHPAVQVDLVESGGQFQLRCMRSARIVGRKQETRVGMSKVQGR